MTSSLLCAEELNRKVAGDPPLEILKNVNLTVRHGEKIAIVGASGSGKSTLLHLLGLLDRPTSGRILYEGADISPREIPLWRNQNLGMVFQLSYLLEDLSPLDNVLLPCQIRRLRCHQEDLIVQEARALLEHVGLKERIKTPCRSLSGGERQRVALARALIHRPKLILADEPTGNLDPRTARTIQELLLESLPEKGALILVTHDYEFAGRCDHVLRLKEGCLVPFTTP